MNRAGRYIQRHLWWDAEDRQYEIESVWNYTPDPIYGGQYESAELLSIEVYDCEANAPDIDNEMVKGSNVWRYIEQDFNIDIANHIDYYYFDAYTQGQFE